MEYPAFSVASPIVLCFSGLDPSGGAGLQADIEALQSIGAHAAVVATTLTAQDTINVKDIFCVPPTLIIEQARMVLEDMTVKAFKIGLIGSIHQAEAIHTIIKEHPEIPVIFDPIIRAGGGAVLAESDLIAAIENLILPYSYVCTPNTQEAKRLAPEADSLDACAHQIMASGAYAVLLTGTHDTTTEEVVNRLWAEEKLLLTCQWPRLPESYHGSGCTLASVLAGYIAHGVDLVTAARQAQEFTYQTLQSARRMGKGQLIPHRLFWANKPS
jgi:hydroxymethylpyrimidine/phosphomethylpyrimidine kinase